MLFIGGQKASHTDFQCPNDKSGQFQDPIQCDKYYEVVNDSIAIIFSSHFSIAILIFQCDDGVATERLCPDGLVFDSTIRLKNKCDQPFNVDCGDRSELRKF